MSYERERMRHKLEQLRDEIQANIDAEKGVRQPPKPAPTAEQLRLHYVHYGLQMQPKISEESAA